MNKISDLIEMRRGLGELFEENGVTAEVLFLSKLVDEIIVEEQKILLLEAIEKRTLY